MLLDSNIIIYAAQPHHADLRRLIAERAPAVSIISKIEVLGFHRLQPPEKALLEDFFAATTILPLSDAVADSAAELRQQRRMTLGDSIIAATALVHDRTLLTRNLADFRWIPDLRILDPLADGTAPQS